MIQYDLTNMPVKSFLVTGNDDTKDTVALLSGLKRVYKFGI